MVLSSAFARTKHGIVLIGISIIEGSHQLGNAVCEASCISWIMIRSQREIIWENKIWKLWLSLLTTADTDRVVRLSRHNVIYLQTIML